MNRFDLDAYWQTAEYIGSVRLPLDDELCDIFLFWHHAPKRCVSRQRANGRPLAQIGEWEHLRAKACVSLPRLIIHLGLKAAEPGVNKRDIEVAVQQEGWLRMVLAKLQAWYNPETRTLKVAAIDLMPSHSETDPNRDDLLLLLWESFEQRLLDRFPACERILTPAWEAEYDLSAYRHFLTERGYVPHHDHIYGKVAHASE